MHICIFDFLAADENLNQMFAGDLIATSRKLPASPVAGEVWVNN